MASSSSSSSSSSSTSTTSSANPWIKECVRAKSTARNQLGPKRTRPRTNEASMVRFRFSCASSLTSSSVLAANEGSYSCTKTIFNHSNDNRMGYNATGKQPHQGFLEMRGHSLERMRMRCSESTGEGFFPHGWDDSLQACMHAGPLEGGYTGYGEPHPLILTKSSRPILFPRLEEV